MPHTLTLTHSQTRTHARTRMYTLTNTHAHARTHTHSQTLPRPHTHSHTRKHARTHAHARTHSKRARALAHTYTHTRAQARTHSHTHTHTHTHTEIHKHREAKNSAVFLVSLFLVLLMTLRYSSAGIELQHNQCAYVRKRSWPDLPYSVGTEWKPTGTSVRIVAPRSETQIQDFPNMTQLLCRPTGRDTKLRDVDLWRRPKAINFLNVS